jgi:hypothetical protein
LLATQLLFLLQDLFNNPGIQHGRTAFRAGVSRLD